MSRNLIAILRGITPDEIESIAAALLDAGLDRIEVPLNSPDAFTSIERLCEHFKGLGIFGAGTVLHIDEVHALSKIGAQMIVSPNCNVELIRATKEHGMMSFPGVMTPSECFAALGAGADGLKFFPGELVTPTGLKAIRAVLPPETKCLAVGGAKPDNFGEWRAAGANGFGIGSALYKAGDDAATVAKRAKAIVAAYDTAMA